MRASSGLLRSPALCYYILNQFHYVTCVEVHFGVQLVGTRERAAAPVLVRWSRRGSKGRCRHALLAATCAVLAMATDAPIVRVDSGGDPSAPARSGEEFVTMTLPRRGVAGRADASKAWRRSI